MNDLPSVSVVIPCYNGAAFLQETLQSVVSQTTKPLEVIVVDDGSTDESISIATSFSNIVRVISQPNRGPSAARNLGIDNALGEWVAFLDADDLWEAEKLQLQLNAVSSKEHVVCVYSDRFDFISESNRKSNVAASEVHTTDHWRIDLLWNSFFGSSSAICRTEAAKRVRFPEDMRASEDSIFFAQLRELGDFVRIPKPLFNYRRTQQQTTSQPNFRFKSVLAVNGWFEEHRSLYSSEEQELFRMKSIQQLTEAHDLAFWARDHKLVLACREYFKITFADASVPESFRWSLYPAWILKAKDFIDTRR